MLLSDKTNIGLAFYCAKQNGNSNLYVGHEVVLEAKKKKKLEPRGGDRLRPLQSCRHYAVMCSVGLSIKIILYSVFTYLCELA